ncbi:uncharacterized protein MONBRDRAFT_29283, partial [Monosiga brevicollis MX1]
MAAAVQEERTAEQGRRLVATRHIEAGDIVWQESPLACAQFLWNRACGYRACQHCLRSLESPQETVNRLTQHDLPLPNPSHQLEPDARIPQFSCPGCPETYCSEACLEADQVFHAHLCPRAHPTVETLNEAWRDMHPPPESTSITLLLKLVILEHNQPGILSNFCHDFAREINGEMVAHRLLAPEFEASLSQLNELVWAWAEECQLDNAQQWLKPEGFRRLWSLIGTNGAGVASNTLAAYDRQLSALDLDDATQSEVDNTMNTIYEIAGEVVGEFLDAEGSAIYATHSACNHSCRPNAKVFFEGGNFELTIRAEQDIAPGEASCLFDTSEVTISYLDDHILDHGGDVRREVLREQYLFECSCVRCLNPTTTDDEDEESGDDGEQDQEMEEDDMVFVVSPEWFMLIETAFATLTVGAKLNGTKQQ